MPKPLSRRKLLTWLLALVLSSAALAEEDKKDRKDRDEDHKEDRDKDPKPQPKREDPEQSHTLYAEVYLAKGGVVDLSTGRLETASPWAGFLAAGMWIRAVGKWDEGVFYAQGLEVSQPSYFSYYKGPATLLGLDGGWVEAWHTSESETGVVRRLALRPVAPLSEALLLVRNLGGRLIAFPPGLPSLPNPPQGWMLVKSEVQGNKIRWKNPQRFP